MNGDRRYSTAVLIAAFLVFTACSSGPSDNSNGSAPGNNNAAGPPLPEEGTPQVTSETGASTVPVTLPQVVIAQPGSERPAVEQAAPAANSAPGRSPRLVVPVTRIDFGLQPMEKTISRALAIRNTGNAELRIDAVEPSCGCTAVDFPRTLAPGMKGRIQVKVDTGKSTGQQMKTITIKSNDPEQPNLVVQLAYLVR